MRRGVGLYATGLGGAGVVPHIPQLQLDGIAPGQSYNLFYSLIASGLYTRVDAGPLSASLRGGGGIKFHTLQLPSRVVWSGAAATDVGVGISARRRRLSIEIDWRRSNSKFDSARLPLLRFPGETVVNVSESILTAGLSYTFR